VSSAQGRDALSGRLAIWEGIYTSFQEAAGAVVGAGFNGDEWRTRSVAAASGCLAAMQAGHPIPEQEKQRSALLPPVAATMLANRDRLRILDFGGGLGIGYMTLLEAIPMAAERIDYTIVEVPQIATEGRRLLSGAVGYVEALPADGPFDLVHAASAIQYVDEWRGLLTSLAAYRADFILLSDVFAGSIPTYVTLQHYYGSRIRHWFWNLDELLEVCARAGYALVMKTRVTSRRLGVDNTLPMEQFPEAHRLDQSLHLLLARRG
jgi:putative methyltransferase (TIGR04325 family)